MKAHFLLAFVAGGSAAALVQAEAPVMSALALLPGDTTPAPGAGRQLSPELAAGDGQYLVVWVDERASNVDIVTFTGGPTYNPYAGSKWDIFAARVDLAGNPIDLTPIVVAQELKNQAEPDVAWNGENWLVVWAGQDGIECCADENIHAARVSPAGEVLDVPSIVIDEDTGNSGLRWPTVGSDGTNWVVAWRDLDGGIFTLDGTRVAPDGTLLDPGGVFLRHDTSNSYPIGPDIVWAGDQYLLVWEEGSGGVKGQRLGADLSLLGPVFSINASYWTGYTPKVATDGTDFFVAWRSEPPGQSRELAAARVSATGTLLDSPPLLLTQTTSDWIVDPSVAWDGTNWVTAFGRGDNPLVDTYAIRVSPEGAILDYDTAAIALTTADEIQWETTIAASPGGAGTFVAWRDHRHTPTIYGAHGDIFGAAFGADGTVGTDACLALGAPKQTLLKMIATPAGYTAVYKSETSPETRILAQRLDLDGVPIDLEPVEVAAGPRGLTHPGVAWNGSVHLVVWEDEFENDVFGRRLDSDLIPIDVAPFWIMPGNMPDVAALDDVFLTVSSWEEPHEVRGCYGVRVGGDGSVLDASPRLFSSGYALHPSVAAFGDRWMTAWESHPTHDDPRNSAKGNFVEADGSAGAWFFVDPDATRPVIAAGPSQAMFMFSGDSALHDDIFGRRILPDGTFLDADRIVVTNVPQRQVEPAVAWDGVRYVTAFADMRDADADGSYMGELYAARVADDGTVMDPDGFPVANEASVPEMFAAAAGREGGFVVGGSIFRPEAGYGNYRVGIRTTGAIVEVPQVSLGEVPIAVSRNPFAGVLGVTVLAGDDERATVAVYDAGGRLVRTLFDGRARSELYVEWDGKDDRGVDSGPGVYFLRARVGSRVSIAKAVRL